MVIDLGFSEVCFLILVFCCGCECIGRIVEIIFLLFLFVYVFGIDFFGFKEGFGCGLGVEEGLGLRFVDIGLLLCFVFVLENVFWYIFLVFLCVYRWDNVKFLLFVEDWVLVIVDGLIFLIGLVLLVVVFLCGILESFELVFIV